jgi:hypothetical protein
MIMNIKALAIKCGAYKQTEIIPNKKKEDIGFLEEIVFTHEQLQAFANELTKPQEAVGMKMLEENYNKTDKRFPFVWWKEVPYGSSLYLAPPNHEALQKENERLRERLQNIRGSFTDLHFGESADSLMVRISNAMQEVSQALAKDKP